MTQLFHKAATLIKNFIDSNICMSLNPHKPIVSCYCKQKAQIQTWKQRYEY